MVVVVASLVERRQSLAAAEAGQEGALVERRQCLAAVEEEKAVVVPSVE